ncbi:uncharacterized protein LOC116852357 [Odontomachus brunneus]|uniref:uncharacterized protein LOC116852357 n=1 Tax=Odontomachus brunneus TaxID=486640 RepID=UPI0013F28E7B|nr:uncharacterized protein LOC116852357 [Odontomachus brunneus]
MTSPKLTAEKDSQLRETLTTTKTAARASTKRKSNALCEDVVKDPTQSESNSFKGEAKKRPYRDVPPHLLKLSKNKYPLSHLGLFELGKAALKIMGDLWNEAYDLKNVGRSKFSVKFNSRDAANSIVGRFMEMRDLLFSHSDWIAYIPNYKIQRICISWDINNIDCDKEIQENLSPPPGWLDPWPKVVAVKGISKPDNTSDRTNTDAPRRRKVLAYIITFEGSILYKKFLLSKEYLYKALP